MSADNWAKCPNIGNHQPPPTTDPRTVYTFREDYEIGARDGAVTVVYSGHCEVHGCAAGLSFEVRHIITGIEGSAHGTTT